MPFINIVSRLLVQDNIDMLLELLAGFKISTEFLHASKTTWESAAASVSCTELCLEDKPEQGWDGRPNVEEDE
jgi:hypothetical protein